MKMDSSKKTALQILVLYVLTSCVFLAIVFYGWYQKEKDSIIKEAISTMRDVVHTLMVNLYEQRHNGDLKEALKYATQGFATPFVVVNGAGEALFVHKETLPKDTIQSVLENKSRNLKHRYDSVVFLKNDVYLISMRLSPRLWKQTDLNGKDSVFILVKSNLQNALYKLLALVLTSFFVALFIMSIIAYFLVSLSLKPLREKIDKLNAFIKDSTHEINTPLSIILMSIERFKTDNLTQAQEQKFTRMRLAALNLEQIYQDLLCVSFEEARDLKLEKVALSQLVSERISYFEPFFRKKQIAITFKLDLHTLSEVVLEANYNRIIRVVDNLLDNALKYTNSGGSVEVLLNEKELRIKDNGCGIKKDKLPFIFDRYYRANTEQGGFGVGLSLVKNICDLYHLKIFVKSKENKGSTFILSW